nr:RecName: Full=Beta-benincasin [Benincasa hispida]
RDWRREQERRQERR